MKWAPSPLSGPAVPDVLEEDEKQGHPQGQAHPAQAPLPREQLVDGERGRLGPPWVPQGWSQRVGSTPSTREEREGDRIRRGSVQGTAGGRGPGGRDFKAPPEQLRNRQGWPGASGGPFWGREA